MDMVEPTIEVVSMEEIERGKQIQTDVQIIMEVISQVNWQQSWLLGLMVFHLVMSISIVSLRKRTWVLGGFLVLLGLLCFQSENINQWCANNWKSFSTHQYFDSAGVFITIVFSLPLLLNCFIILVCLLVQTFVTMQTVAQLKMKKKQEYLKKLSDNKKKD